jgi:hypothetical protein
MKCELSDICNMQASMDDNYQARHCAGSSDYNCCTHLMLFQRLADKLGNAEQARELLAKKPGEYDGVCNYGERQGCRMRLDEFMKTECPNPCQHLAMVEAVQGVFEEDAELVLTGIKNMRDRFDGHY